MKLEKLKRAARAVEEIGGIENLKVWMVHLDKIEAIQNELRELDEIIQSVVACGDAYEVSFIHADCSRHVPSGLLLSHLTCEKERLMQEIASYQAKLHLA